VRQPYSAAVNFGVTLAVAWYVWNATPLSVPFLTAVLIFCGCHTMSHTVTTDSNLLFLCTHLSAMVAVALLYRLLRPRYRPSAVATATMSTCVLVDAVCVGAEVSHLVNIGLFLATVLGTFYAHLPRVTQDHIRYIMCLSGQMVEIEHCVNTFPFHVAAPLPL
jgi:hypothetical protein